MREAQGLQMRSRLSPIFNGARGTASRSGKGGAAIIVGSNSTSKRSLSARRSTASCSSPKVLTHAVPPQDAVLTLKEMVRSASPMHTSSLIRPLSGVALDKNSSCRIPDLMRTSQGFVKTSLAYETTGTPDDFQEKSLPSCHRARIS